MILWLALSAAFGCAVCNSIAGILEKISADKEAPAISLDIGLFWRLLHDWPYIIGLLLDGVAGLLTLVAVHFLPLFAAQPIIAFGVVGTALIEQFILRRRLGRWVSLAVLCTFIGLVTLALTASPQKAQTVPGTVRWIIILAPIVLAGTSAILLKLNKNFSTVALSALAGVAFGGTAVTGRMLAFSQPYWHVLFNPLLWSLLAYGFLGVLLLTTALQRHYASTVNAVLVTFETIVPISIGLVFLGDSPKASLWGLTLAGGTLAFIGTFIISYKSHDCFTHDAQRLTRKPTRASQSP